MIYATKWKSLKQFPSRDQDPTLKFKLFEAVPDACLCTYRPTHLDPLRPHMMSTTFLNSINRDIHMFI